MNGENHFGDAEWGLQQLFADMRGRYAPRQVQQVQQSIPVQVPPVSQVPSVQAQPQLVQAPMAQMAQPMMPVSPPTVVNNIYNNGSAQSPVSPVLNQPMVKKSLGKTITKVLIFAGVIAVAYYVMQDPKFILQWGTNVITKIVGLF